jgi:hypothetical protein
VMSAGWTCFAAPPLFMGRIFMVAIVEIDRTLMGMSVALMEVFVGDFLGRSSPRRAGQHVERVGRSRRFCISGNSRAEYRGSCRQLRLSA